MAFAGIAPQLQLRRVRPNWRCSPQQKHPRTARRRSKPKVTLSQGSAGQNTRTTSTEDIFAINAGRDLFFPGMDDDTAIAILDADLGTLDARDDRFIAAERLKFFPSAKAAHAIIRFVSKFDPENRSSYLLEDLVARRKAVESLGRHRGAFCREEVLTLLRSCLSDSDRYMVEVAVWALAELNVDGDRETLEAVMQVLQNDEVEKRVVIQTLLRASYTPALEAVRPLMACSDPAVASAAMTYVAKLSGDSGAMASVVDILKSTNLNARRAAIEDIKLSEYVPALKEIAVCPNSLVLRARTVRVLLDAMQRRKAGDLTFFDTDMAALVDRLIWDHPDDLDLLGQKKETRKARDPKRNIRQLYKNDAVYAYAASQCLAKDHRYSDSSRVGVDVLKSYNDLGYFDYFGAYHVYKTLGWLQHSDAYDMLAENLLSLPPRFFNHQVGAATALAELGREEAIPLLLKVAENTTIWELKYACLIAAERIGDEGKLRAALSGDDDWLLRTRANMSYGFNHLRSSFVTRT